MGNDIRSSGLQNFRDGPFEQGSGPSINIKQLPLEEYVYVYEGRTYVPKFI